MIPTPCSIIFVPASAVRVLKLYPRMFSPDTKKPMFISSSSLFKVYHSHKQDVGALAPVRLNFVP